MTLSFLHRLLLHPPDSILRRALRASLSCEAGTVTWATQLLQWARTVHAPLDRQVLATAAGVPPPPRQQPSRMAKSSATMVLSPSAGYTAALNCWVDDVEVQRGVRAGPPVQRLEAARLQFFLKKRGPVPRTASAWTRRLPRWYRVFASSAQRSVVARTRLAVPIRGLSIWAVSDFFDDGTHSTFAGDGREHDPGPARTRVCLCGRPASLAHAYACPQVRVALAKFFVELSALDSVTPCRLDPSRVPWSELVHQPPPLWPSFVYAVCQLYCRQ